MARFGVTSKVAKAAITRSGEQKTAASSPWGIQNANIKTTTTTNSNTQQKPQLVTNDTKNATVYERFGKKYQGNAIDESRQIRSTQAKTAKTPAQLIKSKVANPLTTANRDTSPTLGKIEDFGKALMLTITEMKGVFNLSLFLLNLHIVVVLLGAVTLAGFGIELAAADFFSWIPVIGGAVANIATNVVPGMEMAAITLSAAAILGWGSLLAIFIYAITVGGWEPPDSIIIVAAFCTGAYVIPGLQMIPWFLALILFILFNKISQHMNS